MQTGKSLSLLNKSSDASSALSIASVLAKPPQGNSGSRRSQVECTRETNKRNENKAKRMLSFLYPKNKKRDKSCGILDRFSEQNKIKFFLSLAPGSSQRKFASPEKWDERKTERAEQEQTKFTAENVVFLPLFLFAIALFSRKLIAHAYYCSTSDSVETWQLMSHALLNIAHRQHFHFHFVWLRAEDSCAETCDPWIKWKTLIITISQFSTRVRWQRVHFGSTERRVCPARKLPSACIRLLSRLANRACVGVDVGCND